MAHSDYETARARINRIAAHVAASRQDIIDAHANRDWLALGYGTWAELCEAEFHGAMVGLPRGERRETVAELTEAGMSTRAIGAALGVSDMTVRRDTAGATNVAPAPTPVTGLDGKTYTRPIKSITVVEEITVDAETGEIVEPTPAPATTPPRPHRRPLGDAMRDATHDLIKTAERVERLTQDDRWKRNAQQIGDLARRDLLRAQEVLDRALQACN